MKLRHKYLLKAGESKTRGKRGGSHAWSPSGSSLRGHEFKWCMKWCMV